MLCTNRRDLHKRLSFHLLCKLASGSSRAFDTPVHQKQNNTLWINHQHPFGNVFTKKKQTNKTKQIQTNKRAKKKQTNKQKGNTKKISKQYKANLKKKKKKEKKVNTQPCIVDRQYMFLSIWLQVYAIVMMFLD